MNILSLYWGICSTAALFDGNKIVAAVSEERFSRIKNDDRFPEKSINYCLKAVGLKGRDIDGVAIASMDAGSLFDILARKSQWTVEDYVRQQHEVWYPILYNNKKIDFKKVFNDKFDFSIYPTWYWKTAINNPENFSSDVIKIISKYLEINENKIRRIEHHRCHAVYSYLSSPYRGEKVLGITIDGLGDGLNATIGIFDESGKYRRVYHTNQCYIGRIYRYITLLLAMKPNEHEYKVMGLSPYGEKTSEQAYNIFKDTLYVDGLDFKWKNKPKDSYFWFKNKLEGCRFDGIAAGLQKWTEDLITQWVINAINKFGINKIILGGGVAMNVKAVGRLMELDEVEGIFVGGSSSDESMALSSGICMYEDIKEEKKLKWENKKLYPMKNLYLGPEASEDQEREAIKRIKGDEYEIKTIFTANDIARLLKQGKILARCVGRMEFGARALGNRSILADPLDIRVVEKINNKIKNRDFWMPFAPVIMDKHVPNYLMTKKNVLSPYMAIAFKTTLKGYEAMAAASHPSDKTVRPQILSESDNPPLYRILTEFEKITGRGALLNTSFNLHGHPIVNTPEEAIDVLQKSKLDGLVLNNYLILSKGFKD